MLRRSALLILLVVARAEGADCSGFNATRTSLGFPVVEERFRDHVLAVRSGGDTVGTAFIIDAEQGLIATAAHVFTYETDAGVLGRLVPDREVDTPTGRHALYGSYRLHDQYLDREHSFEFVYLPMRAPKLESVSGPPMFEEVTPREDIALLRVDPTKIRDHRALDEISLRLPKRSERLTVLGRSQVDGDDPTMPRRVTRQNDLASGLVQIQGAEIRGGDSGAPVLDDTGALVGLVLKRNTSDVGKLMPLARLLESFSLGDYVDYGASLRSLLDELMDPVPGTSALVQRRLRYEFGSSAHPPSLDWYLWASSYDGEPRPVPAAFVLCPLMLGFGHRELDPVLDRLYASLTFAELEVPDLADTPAEGLADMGRELLTKDGDATANALATTFLTQSATRLVRDDGATGGCLRGPSAAGCSARLSYAAYVIKDAIDLARKARRDEPELARAARSLVEVTPTPAAGALAATLGRFLESRDEPGEALAVYDAIADAPAWVVSRAAAIERRAGREQSAIARLESVTRPPDYISIDLGDLYYERGDLEAATEAFGSVERPEQHPWLQERLRAIRVMEN